VFARADGAAVANAVTAWVALGSPTSQVEVFMGTTYLGQADVSLAADTYYTIQLLIDAAGRWFVWYAPTSGPLGSPVASGWDSALATGGARETGRVGLYDLNGSASAGTRTYDNFGAFVPVADAAVFASQSLTLSHQSATREDSTGAFSSPVSRVRGRYLTIPPAGPEDRQTRLLIKGFRNDPYTAGDGGIDDISATLYATPRGLVVPEG
jgi:hypothetical protein